MQYRVVWTITDVREEIIEADSEDEAREQWMTECWHDDDELFFIEDEQGNQTIYN